MGVNMFLLRNLNIFIKNYSHTIFYDIIRTEIKGVHNK